MWKSRIASLTRWLDGRGWKDVAVPAPVAWEPAPPAPGSAVVQGEPAVTRWSAIASESGGLAPDRRRIAQTFDSAHPVRRRADLFGRDQELAQLLAAVLDFQQHAVIHGARGSGKTSLVRVLGEHADEAGAAVLYFACEPNATFADLLRPYLDALPASAFAPGGQRAFAQKREHLAEDFGPRAFVDLVAERIVSPTILIFDEFDRIEDASVKTDVAAAMKLLSDALVPVLFVLVGIAQSVSDVVEGHPSLRRHMRIVSLSRIGSAAVDALLARGEASTGVRFDPDARRMIVAAASGSPYHLRMLAGNASLAAVAQGTDTVTRAHARTGFVDAFSQWAQMNGPDARLFVKTMHTAAPELRAAMERLARAAAAMDAVPLDADELTGAAASIASALIHEPGGGDEPDTIQFRDSTAPQMLITLLMTAPVPTNAAATDAPQESDLANTR